MLKRESQGMPLSCSACARWVFRFELDATLLEPESMISIDFFLGVWLTQENVGRNGRGADCIDIRFVKCLLNF